MLSRNIKSTRKERIQWLLEGGVFAFGDIDMEVSVNLLNKSKFY